MRPVRATFFAFGFFWGTWAVVALDVQRFLGFSDAELGLLAGGDGGRRCPRQRRQAASSPNGSARARCSARALVLWGALLLGVAATTNSGVLPSLPGGGRGRWSRRRRHERRRHRRARQRLDAVCCGCTRCSTPARSWARRRPACCSNRGVSFRAIWAGVAVCRVRSRACGAASRTCRRASAVSTTRFAKALPPCAPPGSRPLAVVFAIGAVVEGGIGTWGVLFLRANLGLAAVAGAAAYVAGQALGDSRAVHARVDDVPPRGSAGRAMGSRPRRRRAVGRGDGEQRRARCGRSRRRCRRRVGVLALAARVRQPRQHPARAGRRRSERVRLRRLPRRPARRRDGSRRRPTCGGASARWLLPRSRARSSGSARHVVPRPGRVSAR